MAARIHFGDGELVKIKIGEHVWGKIHNNEFNEARVRKIEARSGSSVIISHNSKILFEVDNDTDRTIRRDVCLRFKKCTKIDVKNICRQEVPCDPCEEWDYIIVGLGSAGSILARKLSDDMKSKVLVIETGRSHQKDPIILDPNWIPIASTLLYNPKYSITYPIPSSNPANPFGAFVYSDGVGWGGSSAHNFLISGRGTPAIYNLWATMSGHPIWSYSNMLPRMKALEHYFPDPPGSGDPSQRGFNGPISVTQSPPLTHTPLLNSMSTIFNAPYIPDYNNPNFGNVGTASNQEFKTPQPDSRRSYSGLDFLPIGEIVDKYGNGLHGRKLKIVSNAQVLNFDTRESLSGLKATSIKYVYTGSDALVQEAHLRKKGILILAAGSINTPKILLNSGIGPANELASVGIPVKVDSPHVGKNLQDHYGSFAIVTGSADNLSAVYTDLVSPSDGTRRAQLLNINIAPNTIQVLPSLLQPKSRGSVTLADPNPMSQPKVTIGTYTDGDETMTGSDLNLAVTFYKQIKVAAEAAGGSVLSPPAFAYTGGDAGLAAFAKTDANIILQSHNVGTCRMGTNISNAVTDGNLGVFGLKNVKIGDVSIQPVIVDVNTCFSAYYVALTLAQILGVTTPPAL